MQVQDAECRHRLQGRGGCQPLSFQVRMEPIGQSCRASAPTSNNHAPTLACRWTAPHPASRVCRTSPEVNDRSVLKPSRDRPVDRQQQIFAGLILWLSSHCTQQHTSTACRPTWPDSWLAKPGHASRADSMWPVGTQASQRHDNSPCPVSGLWDSKTQLASDFCLACRPAESTRRPMAWGRAPSPSVLTQPGWSVMAAQ